MTAREGSPKAGPDERVPPAPGPWQIALGTMPFRIGVDENGLGPRLGPMIVTAVMAEVDEAGARRASRRPRGKLAEVLGDSKAKLAHGDVALGEAWARALAARGCTRGARGPTSVEELVHAISVDEPIELRRPCGRGGAEMCWSPHGERLEAEDHVVAELDRHLTALAQKGVAVRAVRSTIVCTKRLNDAFDAGRSRFVVDLHAMEALVLGLRELAGAEVDAVCGKVGGIGNYVDFFGPLAGRLHLELERTRARSAYHFPGVGRIAFVMDADDGDLLVGLASMVGKWLREVLMGRIARSLGGEGATASGYWDDRTSQLIEASRIVRRRRGIPEVCFERKTATGA